jgi:hypothetical protein
MQFFAASGSSVAKPERRADSQPKPLATLGDPLKAPYNPKRGALAPRKETPIAGAPGTETRATADPGDSVGEDIARPLAPKLAALLQASEKKKPFVLPAWAPLAGVALVVVLLGFGILSLASRPGSGSKQNSRAQSGSLMVNSNIAGARISIDGQETEMKTPFEVTGLPIDQPIRLAVALEGYLPVPSDAVVIIPSSSGRTTANFNLLRGRVFELETEPPGAAVELNGERLSGITPLTLPAVPLDSTASVTVMLEGHLPAMLHIMSRADTATVARVKLEAAKQIDVVSEPPNARVFIDNLVRGTTPLYDVLVPASRSFRLRVEKRGYKTWKKQLAAKQMRERLIEADLQVLPLLAMPLSREEMKQARDYDRKLAQIHAEILRSKGLLARAEKRLSAVENQPSFFVGQLADAQRAVDDVRSKIELLEEEQQETETAVTEFRQKVMAKIDGAEDER